MHVAHSTFIKPKAKENHRRAIKAKNQNSTAFSPGDKVYSKRDKSNLSTGLGTFIGSERELSFNNGGT